MDGYKILTLSGWTQPADALRRVVAHADVVDYATSRSMEDVGKKLPAREYDVVIGWSMGGLIARQLIKAGYLRAKALVALSSAFQFVRDEQCQAGMPKDTFELFYSNYRDDTERTIRRFQGLLGKGDKHYKRLAAEFEHHPEVMQTEHWMPWLDVLRQYSAGREDYSMLPPTLIVHGMNDEVIRVEQAKHLHAHLDNATLELWEDCAHAPHLHDTERLRATISKFVSEAVT